MVAKETDMIGTITITRFELERRVVPVGRRRRPFSQRGIFRGTEIKWCGGTVKHPRHTSAQWRLREIHVFSVEYE